MSIILKFLALIRFERINEIMLSLSNRVHLSVIEKKTGQKIKYIGQGPGLTRITGRPLKFKIAATSHLKSNTFIECSGGVEIGKYFHTGRGLTIFSTNHNYKSKTKIPYDKIPIKKPVIIKDFVWLGANVTIVPGVTIGEGVVVGSGSVITKNIPEYAIVGGNPAKVIKYRDIEVFMDLKEKKCFF